MATCCCCKKKEKRLHANFTNPGQILHIAPLTSETVWNNDLFEVGEFGTAALCVFVLLVRVAAIFILMLPVLMLICVSVAPLGLSLVLKAQTVSNTKGLFMYQKTLLDFLCSFNRVKKVQRASKCV